MQFGVHLANWGPWVTPTSIGALAQRAEALGYDSVWVSDHVVAPLDARSAYPYDPQSGITPDSAATHYEPLITLAYAAGLTRRVRLGTTVLIVPMRNPVYTAKLLATLDALSQGRLVLGVGVGWLAEEFRALDASPFEQRGAVLEEYLRLYQSLWNDDVTTFDGDHYRLDAVRSYPKPAQRPSPPIWFGGHSQVAMRRALELGSGWHPVRLGIDDFRAKMATFRQLAADRERDLSDFTISLRCDVGIGVDPSGAKDYQLFGRSAAVADAVERYRDAGCTHLMLEFHPRESTEQMLESMQRFADTVVPRVRVRR